MFGNLKQSLKNLINKIRIFKRLKAYKLENIKLKDQLIYKRKVEFELREELRKVVKENIDNFHEFEEFIKSATEEITKANNMSEELLKRRDEFLMRLESKIPDDVIGGDFSTYKFWLAESFISPNYKPYKPVDDKEVFIDTIKARHIIKGLKDDKEKGTE